ncbi:MAG: hypothetical protein ACP5IL_15160 [Syntrophobacteraceae bacterium]
MRSGIIAFLAAVMALSVYLGAARAQEPSQAPAPVEQPLVSEGEFAIKLSAALNLGFTHDEVEAEDSLAKIDVSPQNGWISDYPMTPDIVEEIRQSALRSASAGKLLMSKTDAAQAVSDVSARFNLPLTSGGAPGESADSSGSNQSVSTSYLDSYYNDYGPPVVTYYAPPQEYGYLYGWVPYPFWWGGNYFGGYYILNDFDCREGYYNHGRHHRRYHGREGHRITNHATGANGAVSRIDPLARAGIAGGTSKFPGKSLPENRSTFHSARGQADARAIVNHSSKASPAGMAGGAYPAGARTETHGNRGAQPRSDHTGQARGPVFPATHSLGAGGIQSAPSANSSSTGISSGGFVGGHP